MCGLSVSNHDILPSAKCYEHLPMFKLQYCTKFGHFVFMCT